MSVPTPAAAAAEEGASQDAPPKLAAADQAPQEGDEQGGGLGLAVPLDPPEFSDPAILAAKPAAPRYNRDELLQMRQLPLSQKRPEFLSPAFNNSSGIWDPELWHRSRSDTPNENGLRNDQLDSHKRRPGDPRERLRKEQDGIILSPQRRSFNSGCFVPLKENQRSNRPHSPLGKSDSHMGQRELSLGVRRIGSGRILTRDVPWDFPGKPEGDNDIGYPRRNADREDRYDRRPFGRDFDMGKEKDKHSGRSNGRYNERRRAPENHEKQPEWFVLGPASQTETIELHGFEDADNERFIKKKHSLIQKKKLKEKTLIKNAEAQQADSKEKQNENSKTAADKSDTQEAADAAPTRPSPIAENGGGGDAEKSKLNSETTSDQNSFNFDDILKCDTITNLLSNGVDEGETTGSRFSRWFKRDSPVKQTLGDSRRSSLQDEHISRNLLNDILEPKVTIPSDSDLYFVPISPAANTGSTNLRSSILSSSQKPLNLMEMLQRGKQQSENQSAKNMDVLGKVMSLEELEARMLHQGGGDPGATARVMASQNKQMSQKPEDDMTAFKRLLAQVSGGHAVTANNGPIAPKPQPMSLMEMLSHSQQQDEAAHLAAAAQMIGSSSPNHLHTAHIANDLTFKLQQMQAQQRQHAQLDMLNKLMNAGMHRQQLGTSPLPEMGLNQSRELLSRPEAQAILQGLKRGDITPQHLYQQLAANPAMQPRHRELLLTILKLHGGGGAGMGPSPRVLSPVPPHPLFQPQQQQLRVSPLPNAMHQRIPSPRELQVHTQNIMQRALIKKKLEEQQENYKKRQEMQQRNQSPGRGVSPAKHTSSPTPLAFTPTSVLRKMTAEKDDGTKDGNKSGDVHGKLPQGRPVTGMKPSLQQQPQQPWNIQQLKQPAGRPIVKANTNLQTTNQTQADQQQFYHQQQRLFSQQQPRKMGPQFPSMTHSQPGTSSHQSLHHFGHQHNLFSSTPPQFQQQQLTQHQLRAQHQQHQPPQQPFGSRQSSQPHWSQQHHQMLTGHSFDSRASHLGERGGAGNSSGDLSPTSNQLARWFSPELLERARAGKVPNMPSATAAQHAISLEEIERQTAPPVHN